MFHIIMSKGERNFFKDENWFLRKNKCHYFPESEVFLPVAMYQKIKVYSNFEKDYENI